MRRINRAEQDPTFSKFWSEMTKDFFKVEVLQNYAEDWGESYKAWLDGDKEKARELLKKEPGWQEGKEKVNKIRVHIVEEPLTTYLEWEIEYYKLVNIPKVGEKVFLLDKSEIKADLKIPKGDILIFDKKKVIENIYNNNGLSTGSKIYENPEELKPFLELRDIILRSNLQEVTS